MLRFGIINNGACYEVQIKRVKAPSCIKTCDFTFETLNNLHLVNNYPLQSKKEMVQKLIYFQMG